MPKIDHRVALRHLDEVTHKEIIELMNDPQVRRHLPLARGSFGSADCERFVASKERMWREVGFGPWAITIDEVFAGWGGLQPEGADADVGLVLHAHYWGQGKTIYEWFVRYAFDNLGLESVTALLPTSRGQAAGVVRLGFQREEAVVLDGVRFTRYRLYAADRGSARNRPHSGKDAQGRSGLT